MPHPNDPSLRSFIEIDPASDFPIQNLPYGVFSTAANPTPRVGVAIGNYVLDLWELEQDSRLDVGALGVFSGPSLNAFMALGPKVWTRTRARISELLRHDHPELRDNGELRQRALVPLRDARLHLPFAVSGYTDFYSSKEHATNVGVMFRGKDNALQPNWLHMPIAYNGRASTVVVSGTRVKRPRGQLKPPNVDAPSFGPCKRLDFELEMGVVIGEPSAMGGMLTLRPQSKSVNLNMSMMDRVPTQIILTPDNRFLIAVVLFDARPSEAGLTLAKEKTLVTFPIMMGACAFLMPIGGARFIQAGRYSLRSALGLVIGGIPGVLIAAFLVKSLPIEQLRWLVTFVVLYAAALMLHSATKGNPTPLS